MTSAYQKRIIRWLDSRDNPKQWFTAFEIAVGVDLRLDQANRCLSSLVSKGYVVKSKDESGDVYNRLMYVKAYSIT